MKPLTKGLTEYESFEKASPERRRSLRQERLILEVTEVLSETISRKGISKKELANRLGKTKGYVSQLLSGGRNLTLRTVADVADALGCRVSVTLSAQPGQLPVEDPQVVGGPLQSQSAFLKFVIDQPFVIERWLDLSWKSVSQVDVPAGKVGSSGLRAAA